MGIPWFMERYRLTGINMDAGHDVSVIIEARNEAEARQQAAKLRVAVSELIPLSNAVIAKASAFRGPRGLLAVLVLLLALFAFGTAGGFLWIHFRLAEYEASQNTTEPTPISSSLAARLQAIEADLSRLKIDRDTTSGAIGINAAQLAEKVRQELQEMTGEALPRDRLSDGVGDRATVLADLDRLEKKRESIVAQLARIQQRIDEAVDGLNNSLDSFERERWRKFLDVYQGQRKTLNAELNSVDDEIYTLRKSL